MDVNEWRQRTTSALLKALQTACSHYNGVMKDHIHALLKCGNVLQSYFILTQTSQTVANETKQDFFLDLTKMIGVIGRNIACRDMDGMEVTQRTGAWRKSLALLVPWWTRPIDLKQQITSRRSQTTGAHDGTVKDAWKYSLLPTEAGTYIHEAFGESIAALCARMFGWDQLTHIVPGRMVHAGLPWIGVTPDAICVVDEGAFHEVSRRLFAGETIRAVERGSGAPWMTVELKTIHGRTQKSVSHVTDENATVQECEIDHLLGIYENDREVTKDAAKEAALKLFVRKLEVAGWIPKNLYAENNDYKLENNVVKLQKSQNTSKRKTCAFFKKSTVLYPTTQFEMLRVENAGGEVYPNLAKLASSTLNVIDEPPKKKSRMYQQVVTIKEMVTPGKACMIVYRVGETAMNEVMFRLDWDKAPLMLTLNTNHFNQVMGQHAVARQLNEDVKSLYAVALTSHRRSSASFGKDPIQLAVVYAYDVGIQAAAVDAYSDVMCRELALAAQGISNSESLHAMLLRETSVEERRSMLYRRASTMDKLADPSDSEVLMAYREASKVCYTKNRSYVEEEEEEEWDADDVTE